MAATLQEKLDTLKAGRRRRVEARARDLIDREMALADLRREMTLTQTELAEALGIGQEGVSRIENRSDLLISTLRDYVEAMGGTLRVIADFPDRRSIELAGLVTTGRRTAKGSRKSSRASPQSSR